MFLQDDWQGQTAADGLLQGAEHGEHVLWKSSVFKKKNSQDSLPALTQKIFILTNW